jgi:hypothetical protein
MVASHTGQNTFYEVPGFMMGFPLYNLDEALTYVIDALRKNGFLVQILPEPHIGVLYISWDPEELKPPKPIKLIRPREDIAYQQRLLESSRAYPPAISVNLTEESSIMNDPLLQSKFQYNANGTANGTATGTGTGTGTANGNGKYIMPFPESLTPQNIPLPPSQKTRPTKHEPMYLANLRLF